MREQSERMEITSTALLALWEKAFDAFKEAEDLTTGRHLTRNACDAMHEMWSSFGCVLNELRANSTLQGSPGAQRKEIP